MGPATRYTFRRNSASMTHRAVAAAPQTSQLGGPHCPKETPNYLKGLKVALVQERNIALRIALNRIFCPQILYFSFEILRRRFLLNSVIKTAY